MKIPLKTKVEVKCLKEFNHCLLILRIKKKKKKFTNGSNGAKIEEKVAKKTSKFLLLREYDMLQDLVQMLSTQKGGRGGGPRISKNNTHPH